MKKEDKVWESTKWKIEKKMEKVMEEKTRKKEALFTSVFQYTYLWFLAADVSDVGFILDAPFVLDRKKI